MNQTWQKLFSTSSTFSVIKLLAPADEHEPAAPSVAAKDHAYRHDGEASGVPGGGWCR